MYRHTELTEKIICACYKVYNNLGSGFLEKVYENALKLELSKNNLDVRHQEPVSVFYEGQVIGEYFADLLVENKVILELKSVEALTTIHEVQLVNYLKATGLEVGLLINFGPKIEIKGKINSIRHV